LTCKQGFEVNIPYAKYGRVQVRCSHCNSKNVVRLISRVRVAHSEESRLDSLVDPSALDGLEDDPKTLGRMMRTMSKELGEDMGPEFDEVVGRLEKGQSPDEIEKALPDLGGEGGDSGALDNL